MNASFEDLGLSPDLLKSIEDMGFEEPSPIQLLAVPPLLAGRDVMGQAQTGTGKTAAFGLPILEKAVPGGNIQAIVLCPTRELAIQVAEELGRAGRPQEKHDHSAHLRRPAHRTAVSGPGQGRARWLWARREESSITCSAVPFALTTLP